MKALLTTLILFWSSGAKGDPESFVNAPDGTLLTLSEYHLPTTLKSMLYFEKLRPDASVELVTALQLAIAARKGDEIPVPQMRALVFPLEQRLAPFADRNEKSSMRYILDFCLYGVKARIKVIEDYERNRSP